VHNAACAAVDRHHFGDLVRRKQFPGGSARRLVVMKLGSSAADNVIGAVQHENSIFRHANTVAMSEGLERRPIVDTTTSASTAPHIAVTVPYFRASRALQPRRDRGKGLFVTRAVDLKRRFGSPRLSIMQTR
jgi:hypothetical protein